MVINYYKIVSFIDIFGFAISLFTFVCSCRKMFITKNPIAFFNLPLISLLISVSFVLDLMGIILDKKDFFFIAKVISGFMICYSIILKLLFPFLFSKDTIPNIDKDFVEAIQEDIEKKKYPPRNVLDGIDLNKVEIKLNHFLAEKGFKDEELRLPDFAAYLGITTHQASKYLNKYLSMSYVDFLNYHRINEVMDMIRIKSDYNLLNIALECGFNSASSFHRASIKFTGKSPRNLRKDIFLNDGGNQSEL
ncbi:helix-turn-helix domain-containing protein [Leptospira santarosai]|uniref:helix-turn-helix domain-containing protein n=1 Tax=Leptospira santarosai TaxID=28183 RepID=UPI0002E50011|nr:helix-turn-helix domain-containing protein [Leptospira santarosai]